MHFISQKKGHIKLEKRLQVIAAYYSDYILQRSTYEAVLGGQSRPTLYKSKQQNNDFLIQNANVILKAETITQDFSLPGSALTTGL